MSAIDKIEDLQQFVRERIEAASQVAEEICLSANARNRDFSESKGLEPRASWIQEVPHFRQLDIGHAARIWGVALSVDMRQSTKRALTIGDRNMFLSLHAFLPTLTRLVGKADGVVVGLRGDGLISVFGHKILEHSDDLVSSEDAGNGLQNAAQCGHAMLQAIREVVNPVLEEFDIPSDIQIGVGVDTGQMVITRIGFEAAAETTAYGHCVNHSCKLAKRDRGKLLFTKGARDTFPTEQGGLARFISIADCFSLEYPSTYEVLEKPSRRKIH